jgi:hypothetical protein
MTPRTHRAWAILRRSDNLLDGYREWLEGETNGTTRARLFATRKLAREYIAKEWWFLKGRPHLQREPHGCRMPCVVSVSVTIAIL